MTVKEKLVGVVQQEMRTDFITACEYVTAWLDRFHKSDKKKEHINIGQKRFLVCK